MKYNPGKTNDKFIASQQFQSNDIIPACPRRKRKRRNNCVVVRNQLPAQVVKNASPRREIFLHLPSTSKNDSKIRVICKSFQDADLAICDLTITYEREGAVDFTMPFMNLGNF